MDPIFERLSQVVCDVFALYQDEPLELTEETTAADVPGWDSLMHVTVVVHVERAFHVRFSSAEVGNLKKLGDLAQLVRRHLSASGQAVATEERVGTPSCGGGWITESPPDS